MKDTSTRKVCRKEAWARKGQFSNTEKDKRISRNQKANDLKKIKMMIDENKDIIVKYWRRYFGKEVDDED